MTKPVQADSKETIAAQVPEAPSGKIEGDSSERIVAKVPEASSGTLES